MLRIIITHSSFPLNVEKNFSPSLKLGTLKDKLYLICGTNLGSMKIQLKDRDGNILKELTDEETTLEDYGIRDYFIVHVIDTNIFSKLNELSDTSKVDKYVMSEEEYNKRDNTFRRWKKDNIEMLKDPEEERKVDVKTNQFDKKPDIKVGSRCEVQVPGTPRGEVMYVGKMKFGTGGYYIGVKLDEPYGKNDGSIKGCRYFTCEKGYGRFVREDKIRVGDYPEETFSSDDEI